MTTTHGQPQTGPSRTPQNAPQAAPQPAPESAETKEIMRRYRSRKEIYGDITTLEDLDKKDYKGLVEPLEKKESDLPNIESDFLKKAREFEKSSGNPAIRDYLNEIFKAQNADELDGLMKKSTIIRESAVTPELRIKISKLHDEYLKYRDRIRRQIEVEKIIKKQKETIATSPQEYARSAEKFIADKIQGIRENWAGMDGKERFIAGATMLVGLSWVLNSKSEGMAEFRDILKKAGFVGIGLVMANSGAKLVTGKTGMELLSSHIEDRSGKRNFLKDAFNTDKHGAEMMNNALVHMNEYDFIEVAEAYLRQEAKYKTYPVPDNQRELPIGGLAEDQMHPRQIYIAMRLFARKLEKEGSSMEQLVNGFKKAEKEAKNKNKPFIRPTFGLILAAVLQKDILKSKVVGGKIVYSRTESIEVPYDQSQQSAMRKWWLVTGTPEDWKKQYNDPNAFPREEFSADNAKHISSNVLDIKKPLSGVMEDQYFKRYTAGFKNLYNLRMKDKPAEKVHMLEDSVDKAVYISSKVPVDYEAFKSQTRDYARIAAVRSAYDEALKKIETQYGNMPAFKAVKGRINEFVQPVFGVFLAETSAKKMGPIKEYVMFLRLVLPGSVEFALRKDKEWTDGDMIQMMKKELPMKAGEKLTRAEFETLSQRIKRAEAKTKFPNLTLTSSFTSVYGGAYEFFLTNMKLRKNDTAKIEKVLDFFSNKFAGSGISKVGLVRYLASHKFTDKEIKEAYGTAEAVPNEGLDIRKLVDKRREEAEKELEAELTKKEQEINNMPQTLPADIIKVRKAKKELAELKDRKLAWDFIIKNGFDKFFTALCNGDTKAIEAAGSKLFIIPEFAGLYGYITGTTNPGGALNQPMKKLFENSTMDSYKKFILKAGQSRDVLAKTMEAVEEYRKPA